MKALRIRPKTRMTNSHIKAKHQPHTTTFPPIMQKSEYKANGLGFTVAEKMAANNPLVKIGSRGTVGSLVLQKSSTSVGYN